MDTSKKSYLLDINFLVLLVFAVLCSLFQNTICHIALFASLVIRCLYYLNKKDINGIFALSIEVVPCIGMLTIHSYPLHNIFIMICLLCSVLSCGKLHISKTTFLVYLFFVIIDFVKCFCILGDYEVTIPNLIAVFVLYFSILYSILLYNYTAKTQDKDKCYYFMKSFIGGTFCSVIYGVIYRFLKYGLKYVIISPSVAARNFGASMDPNYFGFYLTLSIAFVLYLYYKKEMRLGSSFAIIIGFLVAGFSTISRMFLFLCVPIAFFMTMILLKELFSKKFVYTLGILSVIIILGIIFWPYLFNNLDLLISRFNVDSSTDITNGRASLAVGYYEIIVENPTYLLFGVGIPKYYKRVGMPLYAHNFYVELFVCEGIFGILLFLIAFMGFLYKIRIFKTIKNTLALLVLFISGLAISFIEVECIYVVVAVTLATIIQLSKENMNEESIASIK